MLLQINEHYISCVMFHCTCNVKVNLSLSLSIMPQSLQAEWI